MYSGLPILLVYHSPPTRSGKQQQDLSDASWRFITKADFVLPAEKWNNLTAECSSRAFIVLEWFAQIIIPFSIECLDVWGVQLASNPSTAKS